MEDLISIERVQSHDYFFSTNVLLTFAVAVIAECCCN